MPTHIPAANPHPCMVFRVGLVRCLLHFVALPDRERSSTGPSCSSFAPSTT
nr:hypothetical protein Q903MT_gene1535 [Picea sitchensis]